MNDDNALAPNAGSARFVIRYQSVATKMKMWVESVGVDPLPDEGRSVRGTNKLAHAHKFPTQIAEEMLPRVREVHFDAWIERADGTQIQPHPADLC